MAPLSSWDSVLKNKKLPFVFASGWRQPLGEGVCCQVHEHQAIEVVYHRSAKGITRLPGLKEIAFQEGSFVVYVPHVPHDQVMDKKGEDLCIHLTVPGRISFPSPCLVTAQAGQLLAAEADFLVSNRSPSNPLEQRLFDLRATTLLFSVIQLADSVREQPLPPGEAPVRLVEAYILEHYAHIDSLREVAAVSGLSHDHLRHLFKQRRGISLVAFLNQTRIERAKSLLTHSRLTLKEVASLCGFQNEYYFSTVFTENTGTPPGIFRRKNGLTRLTAAVR